jgi:hypothetical protein
LVQALNGTRGLMSNNFLLFFLPVIPLEFESPNTPEEILLKIKEVCQGVNKHEAINVLVFATVDGQTFRIYFGPASQHTIISGNVNACDTGAKIRATLTQSDGFPCVITEPCSSVCITQSIACSPSDIRICLPYP